MTRFRLANFRLFRLIIVILYPCSMCPVLFYYLGNVYEGVILNSLGSAVIDDGAGAAVVDVACVVLDGFVRGKARLVAIPVEVSF